MDKINLDISSRGSAYIERYGLIMQASSECTCDFNIETDELYLSDSFKTVFGIQPVSLDKNRELYLSHIHTDDIVRVNSEFNDALYNSIELNFNIKYRLIKGDGEYAFIEDKVIVLRDEENKPYRVLNVIKDVSSEYFYQQIESIEREIMALSMHEESNLEEIVVRYINLLEHLFPKMKASVLKVVNKCLVNLASPSLPVDYILAINGLIIGENKGSCGTAAYSKKKVIVEDIYNDIRWNDFRELAQKYNLRACWSQPIFNTHNEVVATFANYYEEPRTPNKWEAYAIDRSQKLLSMVISKFDYIERIKNSNDKFRFVNQLTNDAIYEWDIVNEELTWGDGLRRIFGHDLQANIKYPASHWNELIHPDDFERVQKSSDEFLSNPDKIQWETDYRFLRSNKSYAFVKEIGQVIRDENGKALIVYGLIRDVSETMHKRMASQLEDEISIVFNQNVLLADSVQKMLEILLEFTQFKTFELWLKTKDHKQLHLVGKKSKDEKSNIYFDKSNDITHFNTNEGIPGLIFSGKEAVVWNDIHINPNFVRKEAALEAGLKVAGGVPLHIKSNPIGALIFCHTTPIDQNDFRFKILAGLEEFISSEILRKQQEEEMYLLFESSPDILAIASPNGYFTKVNPAFCNLLGYTAEEITNTPFLEYIHPDDINSTQSTYHESMTGIKNSSNFINRYKTKTGNYEWISWSSSDIFGEDGYAFAYGRRITEIVELQKLLDSATKLSKVGGWELDLSTKNNGTLYWSKITREILEVPDEYIPTLSDGLNFYTGEDEIKIRSAIKDLIEKGKEFDLEIQVTLKSGQKKWVRSIGQSERLNGQCVKIYGSYQDIDKQKKVEIELIKTLNQDNRILESIGHGFMALDKEWKVTYWNKHSEEYLFVTKEQAMGHSLWELFPDSKDSLSFHKYSRAIKENVSVHFEDYHPLTDKWFESNAYPTEDGISIFYRDISDRKKVELQIIESERRYSDIFHLSPQPMWIIDIEKATFLDVNNAALEQYGYTHEEFLSMNVGDLRPEEDRNRVYQLLQDTREHETFENIGVWTHLKKNGEKLKVEIRSKSIAFNNIKAKIILATDMTERLNHLEALESQNTKLKEIAWLQSHVVRAPLARLMGLIDLITDDKISSEEKDKSFKYFLDSAKELDVVINDIVKRSHEVRNNS